MQEQQVPLADGASVSVSLHGAGTTCVALGHGAGGTRLSPFLVRLAESLAGSGRRALLFNFPYSEAGRKLPDPKARLEATVAAVAQLALASGVARLVLGGKSMGGRIASQAVAQGLRADGLVFLGYPLHPPGKPDVLRDAHLAAVAAPMLFVQGTRDAFARWDLLEATLAKLGDRATLSKIEQGDHSFKVPKRTGLREADVERLILEGVLGWLAGRGL